MATRKRIFGLIAVCAGLFVPIAFAHWYAILPIQNPVPVVGAPTTSAPVTTTTPVSTVTAWFCVRATGQQDGGPYTSSVNGEAPCGTLVSADGITRFLEERVTTTSSTTTTSTTTQITRTRRSEVQGSTQLRVSSAVAQAFLVISGGAGAGSVQDPGLTNICDFGDNSEAEPYDLGANTSSIADVVATWPAGCNWPNEPTVDGTPTEVDTVAELRTAVTLSGEFVDIAAGTYDLTGTDLSLTGDNLHLYADADATIIGGIDWVESNDVHHIWIEGLDFETTGGAHRWRWEPADDVMLENLCIVGSFDLRRNNPTHFDRLAIINSQIDSRGTDGHPMIIAQGSPGDDQGTDLILANTALIGALVGSQYALRAQSVDGVIQFEMSYNVGTGVGDRAVRLTNVEHAFVGGSVEKPSIGIGNMFFNYLGDANEWPFAVSDGWFENMTLYVPASQAGELADNNALNDGTVTDITVFSTGGVGSPPTGISPFTNGGGIPNVQLWNGTDLPDDSAYGPSRC